MEGAGEGAGGIVPSAADQSSLIESFSAVTSSTPSEAQFFLESHNWQLEPAVQSFFDAAEPAADDHAAVLPASSAVPRGRRRQIRAEEEEEEEGEDDEEDEDYVPPVDEQPQPRPATRRSVAGMASSSGSGRSSKPSKPSGGRPAGGIRTLADLNRRPSPGSDSEDSDGPQEYYTGGEKRWKTYTPSVPFSL